MHLLGWGYGNAPYPKRYRGGPDRPRWDGRDYLAEFCVGLDGSGANTRCSGAVLAARLMIYATRVYIINTAAKIQVCCDNHFHRHVDFFGIIFPNRVRLVGLHMAHHPALSFGRSPIRSPLLTLMVNRSRSLGLSLSRRLMVSMSVEARIGSILGGVLSWIFSGTPCICSDLILPLSGESDQSPLRVQFQNLIVMQILDSDKTPPSN